MCVLVRYPILLHVSADGLEIFLFLAFANSTWTWSASTPLARLLCHRTIAYGAK
jgi:hypothetical protein